MTINEVLNIKILVLVFQVLKEQARVGSLCQDQSIVIHPLCGWVVHKWCTLYNNWTQSKDVGIRCWGTWDNKGLCSLSLEEFYACPWHVEGQCHYVGIVTFHASDDKHSNKYQVKSSDKRQANISLNCVSTLIPIVEWQLFVNQHFLHQKNLQKLRPLVRTSVLQKGAKQSQMIPINICRAARNKCLHNYVLINWRPC